MSEQKNPEKTPAEVQRNVFQALNGRQPKSDQELNEWLATDEGKEAEASLISRFAEIGQS